MLIVVLCFGFIAIICLLVEGFAIVLNAGTAIVQGAALAGMSSIAVIITAGFIVLMRQIIRGEF
jgi:hypothetical protein